MLAGVLGDIKMAVTMPCYMGEDKEAVVKTFDDKIVPVIAYLGNKKFLVGDNITFIDFFFWELLCMVQGVAHPELFEKYPSLKAYHETIRNLPGLKEYLDNPESIDNNRIFNNKSAKLNALVKH